MHKSDPLLAKLVQALGPELVAKQKAWTSATTESTGSAGASTDVGTSSTQPPKKLTEVNDRVGLERGRESSRLLNPSYNDYMP